MPTQKQLRKLARRGLYFGGGGVIKRLVESGEIASADFGFLGKMPEKEREENIPAVGQKADQA